MIIGHGHEVKCAHRGLVEYLSRESQLAPLGTIRIQVFKHPGLCEYRVTPKPSVLEMLGLRHRFGRVKAPHTRNDIRLRHYINLPRHQSEQNSSAGSGIAGEPFHRLKFGSMQSPEVPPGRKKRQFE